MVVNPLQVTYICAMKDKENIIGFTSWEEMDDPQAVKDAFDNFTDVPDFALHGRSEEDGEAEESEAQPDEPAHDEEEKVEPKKTTAVLAESKGSAGAVEAFRFLRERGLLNIPEEQEIPEDEDAASSSLESIIQEAVDTRLEEAVAGLPDEVAGLLKYVHRGGNYQTYVDEILRRHDDDLPADMDMESERDQELIVRTALYAQGRSDKQVDRWIRTLKEDGELQQEAEEYYQEFQERKRKRAQEMADKQAERARQEVEKRKKLRMEVAELVSSTDDVQGVKLSSDDKKSLPSYMTDRRVKLSNGQVVTQMQHDLYEVLNDDKKAILMAKLLRAQLDLSSIMAHIKTDVTNSVHRSLRRTDGMGEVKTKSAAAIIERLLGK